MEEKAYQAFANACEALSLSRFNRPIMRECCEQAGLALLDLQPVKDGLLLVVLHEEETSLLRLLADSIGDCLLLRTCLRMPAYDNDADTYRHFLAQAAAWGRQTGKEDDWHAETVSPGHVILLGGEAEPGLSWHVALTDGQTVREVMALPRRLTLYRHDCIRAMALMMAATRQNGLIADVLARLGATDIGSVDTCRSADTDITQSVQFALNDGARYEARMVNRELVDIYRV